jgi:hypothetical protein
MLFCHVPAICPVERGGPMGAGTLTSLGSELHMLAVSPPPIGPI